MIRIWCVNTDTHIRTLEGPNDHSGAVGFIAFSQDSTLVASASNDKMLIWRVNAGEYTQILESPEGPSGAVSTIAFSHDSTLVVSGSTNGIVQIWCVDMGKCKQSVTGHSSWITSAAFSCDSILMTSASNGKMMRICSVGDRRMQGGNQRWHYNRCFVICSRYYAFTDYSRHFYYT
ncbi:hypothetical protein MAA_11317 [Metarhizium robertsii ARSEF 23]|uniref:Uncharacterized protein n=1 Tax=Metarhizium robertsii (strain ARSEF 23 / ATCC MYA-3075) TaxID=655844 RepID=A0A0B2X833_METRA|nr:uncharacterized protein MAA_11317 [Metarhizium robertsii ARSEF 23]KHO11048.1 hypothetical protein MAA_11317 [Metarhizium robertsii ARSEF 23]